MAKAPTFSLPTGYESEQRKIASRRKLAELLQQQGLEAGPMQSWAQVLGKIGQSTAGAFMNKKADKKEGELSDRMRADYVTALGAFKADEATLDPMAMTQKYRGNAMLGEALKPYEETMTAQLKQRNNRITFGGQSRMEGDIKDGEFEPSKPTDGVIRTPEGNWATNNVATVGALARQGAVGADGAPISMTAPDPTKMPPQGMAAPVQGAPPASAGGVNFNDLTPEERAMVTPILERLANKAGGNGHPSGQPYYPPNPNVPMGNPLSAQRAPAGQIEGKPYWLINGRAYDNPEGQ